MDVPEWLSGMTRNHVGSARAGSNPAVHAFSCHFYENYLLLVVSQFILVYWGNLFIHSRFTINLSVY